MKQLINHTIACLIILRAYARWLGYRLPHCSTRTILQVHFRLKRRLSTSTPQINESSTTVLLYLRLRRQTVFWTNFDFHFLIKITASEARCKFQLNWNRIAGFFRRGSPDGIPFNFDFEWQLQVRAQIVCAQLPAKILKVSQLLPANEQCRRSALSLQPKKIRFVSLLKKVMWTFWYASISEGDALLPLN